MEILKNLVKYSVGAICILLFSACTEFEPRTGISTLAPNDDLGKKNYGIMSRNALFVNNYPVILYPDFASYDDETIFESWEHWFNGDQKCRTPVVDNDFGYIVDCGPDTGKLAIILHFIDANDEKHSLLIEVDILNEEELGFEVDEQAVFPDGRDF